MYDIIEVILPAMIAGIVICSTHVPLGHEVLKRGIIFIDLAIAQIAALGIIIARIYFPDWCEINIHTHTNQMGESHNHWHEIIRVEQVLAFILAITAAFLFKYSEKKAAKIQEAVIGCSFVLASSIALLLSLNVPHGGSEIKAVLAGQILWASWHDIIVISVVYLAVLILWVRCNDRRRRSFFYPIFAICITFSVQLIGIYLVFASLIFPAIISHILGKDKLYISYILSILSYFSGILISYILDLSTSPMIVVMFGFFALSSLIYKRLLNEAGSQDYN